MKDLNNIQGTIERFASVSLEYLELKEKLTTFIAKNYKLVNELNEPFIMDLLGGVYKFLQTAYPSRLCKYASTIVEIKKRGGSSFGHSKSLLQSSRRKRISNKKKRI
jgi:hypothetical protein